MPTDAAALGTDDAERAAAATAFSSGRYTEALQRFTAMLHATAEQPHEQAPILNNRSATHLKLGHPEAAIADASRAVALARTFGPSAIAVKANYRHACALLADDRAMEALQAVDEAACVAKQQPMPAQLTELRERCVAKLVEQSGTKWLQPPNPRPAASTAASATSASSKMRVTSRRLPPSPSPTDRPPLPRTPAEGERRAERTDCEGTAAASFAGAPWWRRALLRTWRPLGTALGTARVRPLVRRLLWRLGGWWRSLHGSLGRLALGWSSSGGGSWAGGSSAGAEACGEALGEGQQAARADECAACGAGALPSAASLGGVPSDLLDACLEPLGLLERLQCKCVSHAMAEAARRLLAAPEAARVVPGTYIVVTRRKAVHPSQIWEEDEMTVEGAGTLTLLEDGRLVGRLEERFVGATRGRGTATEERCIGAWRSDGHIRIALGLGSGAPRRRGLGFLLSLDRAEVSATAQRWCFRGRGASSRSVGVLYVGAAFGDDDDEEVDGGELTMECQLLYT